MPSLSSRVLVALGLCLTSEALAAERAVVIPQIGDQPELPATLILPEGAGPFPAIVIAHDCSGLGPRSSGAPRRWADRLVGEGYAVLMADSFTPRDVPNGVCTEVAEKARNANAYVRSADEYRALAYLRTLEAIDPKRIGLMGGSHGGSTTLASMSDPGDARTPLALAKHNGFAAAIALYPSCGQRYGDWIVTRGADNRGPITGYAGVYKPIAPLLILIGEKDDWTPAAPCERLAEAAKAKGYRLEIKVYPGAHHSFDSDARERFVPARNNINSASGKGATTGGQAAAWEDAKAQVSAFFALHLKEKR